MFSCHDILCRDYGSVFSRDPGPRTYDDDDDDVYVQNPHCDLGALLALIPSHNMEVVDLGLLNLSLSD